MESSYFPLFYDITGWNICFFGAGAVVERRIKTLSQYPCHIYVISQKATTQIQMMAQEKKLIWVIQNIEEKDRKKQIEKILNTLKKQYKEKFTIQKEYAIVFACTNNREVNQEIYEYCKQRDIMVNVADCRQQSDFYFPALLKMDELVIGVTGNGENHKKVKMFMDKIREIYVLAKGRCDNGTRGKKEG